VQIKKFDKTQEDDPQSPMIITVSDRLYDHDSRALISARSFDVPAWLGEWSLHNANLIATPDGVMYPDQTTKRTKVAIVGCQEEYIDKGVLNNPSWEVWSCNSLWKFLRDDRGRFRADRWFELHPMNVQTPTELIKIFECPIPIYILDRKEVGNARAAVEYPLDRVLSLYPRPYFTCTMAYQVALAIVEGFAEIGLYGMELMFGTARERVFERACLEFWIGIALGRGIRVHFHKHSRLAKHPFKYGYDYEQESEFCQAKIDLITHYGLMRTDRPQGDAEWNDHISDLHSIDMAEYRNEGPDL
jgi:hypothetical protein